jgi:hypothetical protein
MDQDPLSIFNPLTAGYTVKFNSMAPNIVKIRWTKGRLPPLEI